jgi:hypothetical protein
MKATSGIETQQMHRVLISRGNDPDSVIIERQMYVDFEGLAGLILAIDKATRQSSIRRALRLPPIKRRKLKGGGE